MTFHDVILFYKLGVLLAVATPVAFWMVHSTQPLVGIVSAPLWPTPALMVTHWEDEDLSHVRPMDNGMGHNQRAFLLVWTLISVFWYSMSKHSRSGTHSWLILLGYFLLCRTWCRLWWSRSRSQCYTDGELIHAWGCCSLRVQCRLHHDWWTWTHHLSGQWTMDSKTNLRFSW